MLWFMGSQRVGHNWATELNWNPYIIKGWLDKLDQAIHYLARSPLGLVSKMTAAAKSLQSCPTLCDPIDGSSPGSPIPGILQARTLEWVAIAFLQFMKVKSESEVAQSCPTLHDPMDCSLPGSPSMGFSRQEYWSGLPLPSPSKMTSCSLLYGHGLQESWLSCAYWLIKPETLAFLVFTQPS